MVYTYPETDLINSEFSSLADPPLTKKTLRVYYNGVALDSIAGPVPLIDLSTQYNTTAGGIAQSSTTRVTINGTIFRSTYYDSTSTPSGTGTAILINAINELKNLFKCNNGIFEIKCNNTNIISGSGVKVLSARFDKSNNNWLFSSDYSVELEYSEPLLSAKINDPMIKNGSDSWSLEPIEDYVYMSTKKIGGVNQKKESHNPRLGAPGDGGVSVPLTDIVPPPLPPATESAPLKFITLPRFKLSRSISAVGLSNTSNTGLCGSGTFPAYHQAKKWVEIQLSKPFNPNNPNNSGVPFISQNTITNVQNFDNLFLYNHLRNIEFNYLQGSYAVNDTWLAMPTGISYLEDYTIERSTDNKNITTVTLAGTIKGLSVSSIPWMSGGIKNPPNDSGIINLSGFNTHNSSGPFARSPQQLDFDRNSTNIISDHKYHNAYSGWINDIKPYLYRRASSITNSIDRNTEYVPSLYTPPRPLNNPIYSYERLLNVIPISTSETLDPRKGSISYSYEFSNKFSLFPGVLSENITINNNMPADVVNEAFVIGRRLGPVLQYMGTSTLATKSVTIELVVPPPSSMEACLLTSRRCPLYIYGPTYSGVKTLVSGLRPFGPRINIFGNMNRSPGTGTVQIIKNDDNWNPSEGRFVKTIEWAYQQCNFTTDNEFKFKEL